MPTALFVHAHSEGDAFVTAMRDRLVAELTKAGYQAAHSDLYAMSFNPVLSPADFPQRKNERHLTYALEQRHSYDTGTLPPDITQEIEKVMAADLLVFTFPVFWFSVPAILKGWIDRVFVSGPFYGGRRIYDQGGLAGKRAIAAFSLGGRDHMFGADSLHGELEAGMLRHFLQGALAYVGLEVLQPFVAYHTPYLTDEQRAQILEDLAQYARNLDKLECLPMPLLGDFDREFRPLTVS